MTYMAAMLIQGKKALQFFFSQTSALIALKCDV